MSDKSGVFLLYFIVIASYKGSLADFEDNSEEVPGTNQEIKFIPRNDSSSIEMGSPDSHESMGDRNITLSSRNKRSYEFLMGLIHNNSKYEVTKMEPSPQIVPPESQDDVNSTASEILLELLVKIAAHPTQWEKVHNLLAKIDRELLVSKEIANKLQEMKIESKKKTYSPNVPEISVEKKTTPTTQNKTEKYFINNEWPTFEDSLERGKVNFLNTASNDNYQKSNQHKATNPKTFAYHRVTGRPLFLNKNPKAYIAVSVIAPKPLVARSKNNEDLILEKQLRQLKPWTHQQNLQNMESIRSRWIIQSDDKDSMAP